MQQGVDKLHLIPAAKKDEVRSFDRAEVLVTFRFVGIADVQAASIPNAKFPESVFVGSADVLGIG